MWPKFIARVKQCYKQLLQMCLIFDERVCAHRAAEPTGWKESEWMVFSFTLDKVLHVQQHKHLLRISWPRQHDGTFCHQWQVLTFSKRMDPMKSEWVLFATKPFTVRKTSVSWKGRRQSFFRKSLSSLGTRSSLRQTYLASSSVF